jgi:hypothetical protein
MGANLLPCNAAVRLQAPGDEAQISERKAAKRMVEGNQILYPQPFSEKSGVGSSAKTRKTNPVPFFLLMP